jgi:ABC-type xylose transport system substrate-binding protein
MDRVREAIFSSLGEEVPEARVLDLFAGSGAMGIEALSRGASSATFVDRDHGAVRTIQRILAGEQYATIYKRIQPEAEKTAELACALAKGEKPPASAVNGKVNNGTGDVPSVLLVPVAVTLTGGGTTQSVADTIVKDKFYGPDTVAQICKGYEAACTAANIK